MNYSSKTTANVKLRVVAMTQSQRAAGAAALGVDAEQLYRNHYQAVLRYVRSRVATQDIAEDLVADVFCRAVGHATAYQALHDTPLPWLYRIAAHRIADHYRRRRPTCSLEAASDLRSLAPDPLEVVVLKSELGSVWEASRSLPPTQRRALWLRYGRQLELREISLLMGKSVEAVKLLIHRALKRIRHLLGLGGVAAPPAPRPAGARSAGRPVVAGRRAEARPVAAKQAAPSSLVAAPAA